MLFEKATRLRVSVYAASVHFVVSAAILFIISAVVIFLWFPFPYSQLSGGLYLLIILCGIDLVCGPLLTAILFNNKKSKKELSIDISVIVVIQVSAMIYGLYSIGMARPVVLAFEYDRYVVVTAAQVDESMLEAAPPQFQKLPWDGPMLLSIRSVEGAKELMSSLDLSLQGIQLSYLPNWWRDYESDIETVKSRMNNLEKLWLRSTEIEKNKINLAIKKIKLHRKEIYYLPMVSEKILDQWSILLNERGEIIGTIKIDGFQ